MRKWVQNRASHVIFAAIFLWTVNEIFNPIDKIWSNNFFGVGLGFLGDLSFFALILIKANIITGLFKASEDIKAREVSEAIQARIIHYQLELAMMCLSCYFVLPVLSLILTRFGIGQWTDSF